MRIGARGRSYVAFVILILITVAVGEIYWIPALDHELLVRLRQDFIIRLNLVADRTAVVEKEHDTSTKWDSFADGMGKLAEARVTLIQSDGRVVGDSDVAPHLLPAVENHRDRPEVARAIKGGLGESIRYSSTTDRRMMYLAMQVPGSSTMLARISLPLSIVDDSKRRGHRILFAGAVIALLVAFVVAMVTTQFLSRPLLMLTKAARRMAAGDLEVRIRSQERDEIGELSRTLDQLAVSLSRSLRELKDDRDLLGRILESMQEGVLVMDGEHRILLANASLKESLLLDSDVVGRTAIEVIRNADLQALIDRSLVSEKAVLGEIEITGMTPRRMQVHASRLSGDPRALLLVLFDVTEIRRLETIRRDFVANVSHELRTPIASIRSSAETLRMAMDNDPKAAREFLEMIERNGQRLGELVNDLLDLSKIEAKDFRPRAVPVDLPPLYKKIISVFSDRAKIRRLKINTEIPTPAPVPIGDSHAVERVLTNLLDNALKYASEGTTITLRVEAQGKTVLLQVIDGGPGIEAKHLPRLFERFYRVDPGRSRDMGGTGLGLSIVKHLVEVMGGEVRVTSEPGKGSTFSVTLPA